MPELQHSILVLPATRGGNECPRINWFEEQNPFKSQPVVNVQIY